MDKRLNEGIFHPWKNIPSFMLQEAFDQNIFYCNLYLHPPKNLPIFYKNIIKYWIEISHCEPTTVESCLNQCLWYNRFIKIDNNPVKKFFSSIVFVHFKNHFDLENNYYFKWRQIINAVPNQWKNIIQSGRYVINSFNAMNDQNLLFVTRNLTIERLTSKQLYLILVSKI